MTRRLKGKGRSTGMVITCRDITILTLVGVMRYVSIEQIAHECFKTPDRARHRVRQLAQAGLVQTILTSSQAPRLYALSRDGLRTLSERQPDLAAKLALPGAIRLAGVRHHLAVVDTRLYLRRWAEGHGGHLLRWESGNSALRHEWGLADLKLQPDGCAELEIAGRAFRLAVEVDCSSEGNGRLAGVMKLHAQALQEGLVDRVWWVVDGSETRRAEISRLAKATGAPGMDVLPHGLTTTAGGQRTDLGSERTHESGSRDPARIAR